MAKGIRLQTQPRSLSLALCPDNAQLDIFRFDLLVSDYDEAIDYYTEVLGLDLLEDTDLGSGKRWVRVAPAGSSCSLLLAKAKNENQAQYIGNQSGGRVFLFMRTDDFQSVFQKYRDKKVRFVEEPRDEEYGRVVVFEDLYGNLWDLIGYKES